MALKRSNALSSSAAEWLPSEPRALPSAAEARKRVIETIQLDIGLSQFWGVDHFLAKISVPLQMDEMEEAALAYVLLKPAGAVELLRQMRACEALNNFSQIVVATASLALCDEDVGLDLVLPLRALLDCASDEEVSEALSILLEFYELSEVLNIWGAHTPRVSDLLAPALSETGDTGTWTGKTD